MSQFIANWALRHPSEAVLEPSCGEARFLLAAADRLRALGAPSSHIAMQLHGVELHDAAASTARAALARQDLMVGVRVSDVFDVEPRSQYDVVSGNPPYVRYQHFSGAARTKGLRAGLAQGVRLTGLASSWAAFTIHASR